jgi:hypothetical protein
MKETVETIIQWSKDTFGDNITLEGQIKKFEDELDEWLESDREDVVELADMAIVACSVARFSFADTIDLFQRISYELSRTLYTGKELEKAIAKKMQINRQRKWGIGKGNFQHIEEGE